MLRQRFAVFRRPRFAVVVTGESISIMGDAAFDIALARTVIRSTGSVSALAGVLQFQAVRRVMLLLLGGAVVDRYSARAIMLVTHAVRALALAVMAIVAFTRPPALWQLAALALVMGICAAFFAPTAETLLPSLVDRCELPQANAIRGIFEATAFIVGPVIGGVLVSTTGVWVVLGVDALTFVIAALTVLVAPTVARHDGTPGGSEVLRAIGEGLAHAGRSHEFRLVLIVISSPRPPSATAASSPPVYRRWPPLWEEHLRSD